MTDKRLPNDEVDLWIEELKKGAASPKSQLNNYPVKYQRGENRRTPPAPRLDQLDGEDQQ